LKIKLVKVVAIFALHLSGLYGATGNDQDFNARVEPVVLSDTALIRHLGQGYFSPQIAIPIDDYKLAPAINNKSELVVLRNGTELFRVDSLRSTTFLNKNPKIFNRPESELKLTRRKALEEIAPDWDFLKPEGENLIRQASWKTGVQADYTFAAGVSDKILLTDRYRLGVLTRKENLFFGASLADVNQYFNLAHSIRAQAGASRFSEFSWSLTAGIPGVRYEVTRAAWPVPEYFWMEKSILDLYAPADSNGFLIVNEDGSARDYGEEGEIVNQFGQRLPSDHSLNVFHRLMFKYWIFNYRILIDGDVYATAIQEFYLEDLPMGSGHWGMGFTTAAGVWVPGIKLSFFEWNAANPNLNGQKRKFIYTPILIDFRFLNAKQFRLEFSTKFYLEDPFQKMLEDKGE
jgi:hypothetical protein